MVNVGIVLLIGFFISFIVCFICKQIAKREPDPREDVDYEIKPQRLLPVLPLRLQGGGGSMKQNDYLTNAVNLLKKVPDSSTLPFFRDATTKKKFNEQLRLLQRDNSKKKKQ